MRKIIDAVMSGFYIALGAIVYFMVPDKIVGAIFFTVGIFLVMNFFNMLFTRVMPLVPFGDYKVKDSIISYFGNFAGAIIAAILVSFTRISGYISEKLIPVAVVKMNDNPLSLLIMAFFCAVLVGYGVMCSRIYQDKKGVGIFFYLLFITAFVICGFDHVVANMFYFSLYVIQQGFNPAIITSLLFVTIGNIIGGLFVGFFEKYRLKAYND